MSAKIFVISDTHFGHTNMALYRGFSSVGEHDNYIVEKWNSVVNKNDTVYLLGDVTMEKATNYEILSKLKGHKKVIMGNHDLGKHSKKMLEYVNTVQSCVKIKGVMLSHIPIHPMELGRFGKNIHGHLHSKHVKRFFGLVKDKRYINVSCEVVDYTPVELNKLL